MGIFVRATPVSCWVNLVCFVPCLRLLVLHSLTHILLPLFNVFVWARAFFTPSQLKSSKVICFSTLCIDLTVCHLVKIGFCFLSRLLASFLSLVSLVCRCSFYSPLALIDWKKSITINVYECGKYLFSCYDKKFTISIRIVKLDAQK